MNDWHDERLVLGLEMCSKEGPQLWPDVARGRIVLLSQLDVSGWPPQLALVGT